MLLRALQKTHLAAAIAVLPTDPKMISMGYIQLMADSYALVSWWEDGTPCALYLHNFINNEQTTILLNALHMYCNKFWSFVISGIKWRKQLLCRMEKQINKKGLNFL